MFRHARALFTFFSAQPIRVRTYEGIYENFMPSNPSPYSVSLPLFPVVVVFIRVSLQLRARSRIKMQSARATRPFGGNGHSESLERGPIYRSMAVVKPSLRERAFSVPRARARIFIALLCSWGFIYIHARARMNGRCERVIIARLFSIRRT